MIMSDYLFFNVLDTTFRKMASFIRESDEYQSDKRNVITIIVDGKSKNVSLEVMGKKIGLYKIKKEWREKNLK